MCTRLVAAAIVLAVWSQAPSCQAAPAEQARVANSTGILLPDAVLPNAYGKERRISELVEGRAAVIAVLGVECPLAKLYAQRLAGMSRSYADKPVAFLAIDANRQDSLTELAAFKQRHGLPFPILKDNDATVADALAAQRTPEVFLFDASGALRYRGRVDDQYGVGYARDEAEQHFLRDALDAVLDGREPPTDQTEAIGCVIGRPREPNEASGVTYSNQIARLFQQHCIECHRDGEIAPFALTDYDEAAGWADTIAEVVRDQRMPPWHADPAVGHYRDERLLSDAEKELIYEWVRQGAPQGDPADLPTRREFVAGWRLPREPDQVVPMRSKAFDVPAEGVIEYQYFAADPGFTEDKWVRAADIVPGCRGVVHHVIVFVSPPPGEERRGLGWLTAYVPGQSSMVLPDGQARFVAAGSKFIFQMHYTPTGAEEQDLTRLGLVFADPESVQEEIITQYAVNGNFEIPPHAANYRVDARNDRFPSGGRLLGMGPHMHVRGKSFRFTGVWPDGRREVLVDVPRYDFNWQHNYRLLEAIDTEPGFRVECRATFDNSARNVVNPDPSAAVRWGDQTFEEMMIAFFEVAVPRGARLDDRAGSRGLVPGAIRKAQRVSEQLLERFDSDGDGAVSRSETPDSFALFAFRRYDGDGDGRITGEEAFEAALARQRR